jgi:hypothetical protein
MQSQNKAFKEWASKQPLWHDRDMVKAIVFGITIGLFVGIVVGYGWGSPDYSNMPITYVRG